MEATTTTVVWYHSVDLLKARGMVIEQWLKNEDVALLQIHDGIHLSGQIGTSDGWDRN